MQYDVGQEIWYGCRKATIVAKTRNPNYDLIYTIKMPDGTLIDTSPIVPDWGAKNEIELNRNRQTLHEALSGIGAKKMRTVKVIISFEASLIIDGEVANLNGLLSCIELHMTKKGDDFATLDTYEIQPQETKIISDETTPDED